MNRKNRERRDAVEGWKAWEHDQLPLRRYEATECFQVVNTDVVEARTEDDAKEIIERNFYARDAEKLVPTENRAKGKMHSVLDAELLES